MSNILKTIALLFVFTAGLTTNHVIAQEKYAKAYEEKGNKAFEKGKYEAVTKKFWLSYDSNTQ